MENSCCAKNNYKKQEKGILKGLLYGVMPHSFCIGFIIFSAIGAVATTAVFKKIMAVPYLLHVLFILSIIMATFSAIIYLKKCDCLNGRGVKSKWRYLTILYGITIFTNFSMFFYVLPVLANINTSGVNIEAGRFSELILKVDIPCTGHAPLIINELKKDKGIKNVKFESPNVFEIIYDSAKISAEGILSAGIFKDYKAQIN